MTKNYLLASICFIPSLAFGQGLIGDDIDVRVFQFPNSTTVTAIDPGVEMIGAGATLGLPGPGRFDVDIRPLSILLTITEEQDLGGSNNSPFMTFSDLDPICRNGQVGTVVDVVVNTNIDPNRVILDATGAVTNPWNGAISFSSTSVVINHDEQIRYVVGDAIELELVLDCTPAGPNLDVSGVCPGPAQVAITGITPGGDVAVVKGASLGSTPVPAGPCIGTLLDLDGPSLVTIINDADNDGNVFANPNLNSPVCGKPIQIIDLTTCTPSNPVFLP
jgi:hypothetical protein